ncbi:Uncharacterised protein [Bordetella pertussis]|nr:Uncharacterised protein [Bordetella pertussis]
MKTLFLSIKNCSKSTGHPRGAARAWKQRPGRAAKQGGPGGKAEKNQSIIK